jgi:DNA modification methylase
VTHFKILQGDCLEQLKNLPDASVQCCVTSPPYYGLRDYGVDGQIGLESTPDAYVKKLVEVFREVRRVLADDGTLFLNLGDSYFSRTKGSGGSNPETSPMQAWKGLQNGQGFDTRKFSAGETGLKNKDLIGIPWMVAFALRADGFYLRQDIIWSKPNPIPESVIDRCTKSHEYIFLLTKSARYYYDNDAVKEDSVCESGTSGCWNGNRDFGLPNGQVRFAKPNLGGSVDGMRNKRSVWSVTTKPYKEAHFATFPPEIPRTCIMAGSKVGDTILDPFAGSGTTGKVAMELGRDFIGIELNQKYVNDLIIPRLENVDPLFNLAVIK